MSAPEFRPDRLFAAMGAAGAEYVVIGGIAAQAHGSTLFTGDVDIAYSTEEPNLERLGRALVALGARLRGVTDTVPFVPDAATLRRTRLLTLSTDAGPLDLLADPPGAPAYADLARRALVVAWAGTDIRIASLDDLIAMKRAAGRPRDLVALDELEAIRRILAESP